MDSTKREERGTGFDDITIAGRTPFMYAFASRRSDASFGLRLTCMHNIESISQASTELELL